MALTKEIGLSLARHTLSAIGGILIARGVLTTGGVYELIGTAMAVLAMVLSFRDKTYTSSQIEGVVRQLLTTIGGFVTWITPDLTLEITGIAGILLSTFLGSINKAKVTPDVPTVPPTEIPVVD